MERTKMSNENRRNKNVKSLDDFLHGKKLSLETIMTREDSETYTLLHFIDKETGVPLFDKWVRKDNMFGENKNADNENTGGREPYVMLFYRRLKKVFRGEFVGNMDCQLSSLTLLSEFIQMNTGKLINKRTKKPLTQADIAKELGLSIRRTAEILSDLKSNGIIVRQDNAYFVKREFFAKGRAFRAD